MAGFPRARQPETVLLLVTRMSPADHPETVSALTREPEPQIPSRLIVLTTTLGRRRWLSSSSLQSSFRRPISWQALRESLVADGHDLSGRLRRVNSRRCAAHYGHGCAQWRNPGTRRSPGHQGQRSHHGLPSGTGSSPGRKYGLPPGDLHRRRARTMRALLYACMCLVGVDRPHSHVLVTSHLMPS